MPPAPSDSKSSKPSADPQLTQIRRAPQPFFLALTCFVASFLLLSAVQISHLARDIHFRQPPLAEGDGPDYENIAFHVAEGTGFGFDWSDPKWRAPYEVDEVTRDKYVVQFNRASEYVPTTARPPLFPWMLAGIYQCIPRGPLAFAAIRVLNGLLLAASGAMAAVLTFWILRSRDVHWIAMLLGIGACVGLAAIDRTTKTYAIDFLTEPLAMFLTQVLVLAVYRWQVSCSTDSSNCELDSKPTGTVYHLFSIGTILALMILARSIFVFFLPGIWLMMIMIGGRKQWKGATIAVLLACLLLSPWWIRNCLLLGRWMPLGTQGPISLLGGYSDEALANQGDWDQAAEIKMREEVSSTELYRSTEDPIARELMVVDEANRRTKAWIAEHTSDMPRLMLLRARSLWSPYSGRSLIWKSLFVLGAAWLIVFRRRESILLLGLPIIATLLVMVLYSTGSRFLVPCYGILYCLSGVGIGGWCIAPRSRNRATDLRPS